MYRSLLSLVSRKRRGLRQSLERWRPVFAMRIGGGYAQSYHLDFAGLGDNEPYVHPNYRFTLGGANDVRGWPADGLGPSVCGYSDGPEPWAFTPWECVPIGGEVAGFGSLELRIKLVGDLGMALFNDWGMAWATPADVPTIPPQPTVGVGVRYATPIGPLRLDFGWRIPLGLGREKNQEYLFWAERRFGIHFALTEAF